MTSADAGNGSAPALGDPIAALRPYEDETRLGFDFEHPPSAEKGLGADPWALRRLPGGGFVGILRARAAVVLLDDALHELARLPAPRSTTGLALGKDGEILVVGELSPVLARFVVREGTLVALPETRIDGVTGLRDVAVSPTGVVWLLDERGGHVLRVDVAGKSAPRVTRAVTTLPVGHGAAQLLATSRHVLALAVTEHTLDVFTTDARGASLPGPPARITHDGPMWGFDARETDGGLVIAAGGVEDHPLDRREGFFGYIDSFLFVLRLRDGKVEKLAETNVSERGVITPKALAIELADDAHADILITGYGSAAALRAHVPLTSSGPPLTFDALTLVPGTRSLTLSSASASSFASANPLLDAWVSVDATGRALAVVPVANETPRDVRSRLGEALFFTSLMAPKNTSDGAQSRFTCETCHFEGYVDGRTHHTGREDVHATTKPLVGLVGNRPYFSRALDPDLSTVAHAEFRVAGAGSGTDPFFAVAPEEHPWLAHLDVHDRVDALELRRSLIRFLEDFSHRPSPVVVARVAAGTARFDPLEREGARLFADRCESCHAARLSADDPASRVPEARWESLVFADAAAIVWGSEGYKQTGVRPYVHPDGARTPSLRRLAKKYPYFTNGSAKSLDDVLDRVTMGPKGVVHDYLAAVRGSPVLDGREKRALRAFLDLL